MPSIAAADIWLRYFGTDLMNRTKELTLTLFACIFLLHTSHGVAQTIFEDVFAGNKERVLKELQSGKDANMKYSGTTLLDLAIFSGKKNTVQLLLDNGADPNIVSVDGYPSMARSIEKFQDENLVKLFLAKGAKIDSKSKSGWTALMSGAASGNMAIVQLLIESGAQINSKNSDGKTSLFWAKSAELARILIDHGIDILAQDKDGEDAFLFQVGYRHLDIARLLLAKGADINHKNSVGESALIRAASREKAAGDVEYPVTRYLLEMGSDVHTTDVRGDTALMVVSGDDSFSSSNKHKRLELLRLMIARGANANARSKNGGTALLAAACRGNSGVVGFLLGIGADPNLGYVDGTTPLICATHHAGKIEVVRLLVRSGSDIDAKDGSGMTALDYAKAGNKTEIATMLQQERCCSVK